MKALFLALVLLSCGRDDAQPVDPIEIPPTKEALQQKFDAKAKALGPLRDGYGWVATEACDAALFSGKLACVLPGVDFGAAEYPEQPGRLNRRPPPFCEVGQGSGTSWSRDMGIGAMAYGWCAKDLALMERHAKYGSDNLWKMGEPLDNGRVVYTPNIFGTLYQIIFALGGDDNVNRAWPNSFPADLVDYEAHLQMMLIWLRTKIDDFGLKFLDHISQAMLERIKEHALRESLCPFYQLMAAKYVTGDYKPVIELLLSESSTCEYYRDDSGLKETEWLWAARLTLDELNR